MSQRIPTGIGIAIILILATTVAVFTWRAYEIDRHTYRHLTSVASSKNQHFETEKPVPQPSTGNSEESFCEQSVNVSGFATKDSSDRKDWKVFVNSRDSYQFEYPSGDLNVEGGRGQYGDRGIWSATIGYPERLGAFGSFQVYCGSTEEAIYFYYGNNERIKIVRSEDVVVNNKRATAILWKDVEYSDKAVGQHIVIQYRDDRALLISGPLGGKEGQLFDSLIESLVFIPEPEER